MTFLENNLYFCNTNRQCESIRLETLRNVVQKVKPSLNWKSCSSIEAHTFLRLVITAGHLRQNCTNFEILLVKE